MEIGNWKSTAQLNGLYRQIRELGLETNIAELEAFGFTTIENALSPELTQELKDAILDLAAERGGRRLDPEQEEDYRGQTFLPYMLYKNPVFKKSVLNEKPLALITYLLGQHCLLSSLGCHLKGPGGDGLELHSDTGNGVPMPFAAYSQVANCNYALTDYTEENGCLAMVPGSHRFMRQPTRWEAGLEGDARNEGVIPIEVPAGTAIIWHGATWHGSFPRKKPGLRINCSNYFCRPYLTTQEDYKNHLPEGFLEGEGGERLATLLGAKIYHGWTDEGPAPEFRVLGKEVSSSWHG